MPKPTKGANASITPGKSAAQLRKEEQERRRKEKEEEAERQRKKAEAERQERERQKQKYRQNAADYARTNNAAATSADARNAERAAAGLPASTEKKEEKKPASFIEQTAASAAAVDRWNQDGRLEDMAEQEAYNERASRNERKQQEFTRQPAKIIPKGAVLDSSVNSGKARKEQRQKSGSAAPTSFDKRNEARAVAGLRPSVVSEGTQIKSEPLTYTPAEKREKERAREGLPVSNVDAFESWLRKENKVINQQSIKAEEDNAQRARQKAQYAEQAARVRQRNGAQRDAYDKRVRESYNQRKDDLWNIIAARPELDKSLQGDDWASYAAKGAKGGNVNVFNIGGQRYTEAQLRGIGFTDEMINALLGYGTAAGSVYRNKQIAREFNQPTYRTMAQPSWAPDEEMAHRTSHAEMYMPELRQQQAVERYKELETKIVNEDFAGEEDRAETYREYQQLQDYYYYWLMEDGGEDALKEEILRTRHLLSLAQSGDVRLDYDAAEQYRIDKIGQSAPFTDSAMYRAMGQTRGDSAAVAFLTNKLTALNRLYESRKQSDLIDRVKRDGVYSQFDRWYELRTQASQNKTENAWEGTIFALDGGDSYTPATNKEYEQERAVNDEISRIAANLKQKGYSAEDFRLFEAYKDEQMYQQTARPYLDFVSEHPLAGPAAALAVQAGTAPIRGLSRIVSDTATGGAGFQGEKALTRATKEAVGLAAENISKNLGNAWGKIYQYSVSAAESFLMGVTLGPATSVVMGLNAAVDSYDDAISRGIDKQNAVALGITSGIFEALFEYLSLDKIKWLDKKTAKSVALTFLKDAAIEGTEEVTTDLANELADYLLAGGLSHYRTALANGMTTEQYAGQFAASLFDSFLGGAFGGVAFGLAKGARSGFHVGTDAVKNTVSDIASGKSIGNTGDVTALIDEAKASGDSQSIKLAEKLEEKLADGKSGDRLAGQLYNRMQNTSVQEAATQRFREIAQEKGEQVEAWEAEEAGRGIAAAANRNHVTEKQAKVLDSETGQQLYEEARSGAEWFEANREKRLEFARRTGVVDDRAGREMRTAEAVEKRAPEVTKAIREGDSYTLVKDGFAGQYVGKEGQRSEARLGGIDSVGEHNELMVVVDDDGKGGPHATAAFSVGEDAAEGTVQAADRDTEILYLDAQAYLTGNADMAEPEQYGANYQFKDGAIMSVAAANTALATYDSRVNPDAHGYMAWYFDAHKAGKSGVSWERYLSLYNQRGEAEWSGYITEEQLAEAFRTGRMEFSPRDGVTRIGNRDLKAGEGAFLQVLDYVAKKLHFAVVAADDIDGKNGFVSSRADVAVISLDADAGRFMTAAFHEIHHLISRELGTTAGRQFTAAVLDTYRTVVGKKRFNEDLKHYEELYKNEFSEEDRAWKVREEMAAQYFGNLAEDNIELLVKRIDQAGGKTLLAKVADALKAFRDAISEALQHLAGIDPATRAAAETSVRNAEKLFDRFIAAAERTMEARETALAEQGEELRKKAEISAESGVRSAENYSLKAVAPVEPSSDAWERTLTTEEAMRRFPNLWNVAAEESDTRNPTQVKVTVSSYRKIYDILKSEGFNGTILDASSGLGYGTRAGREEYGFDVDDIEPYPGKDYRPKYKDYSALNKKYDVIISNAVLNVLPQDQRDALTVKMGEMLNDGGRLFVNVRGNDVFNASSLEVIDRDKMEVYISKSGSYQKGFTKDELKAYLKDALGDGFTVETTNKFGAVAAVVTKAERETKTSSLTPAPKSQEADAGERETFSMKSVVEETRELVAVHNLSAEQLLSDIELGGFPMPSIAVTKAKMGHSMFGDISVVFGKEAIDPERSRYNKVYGGDAYTPTFPHVDYKIDRGQIESIYDRVTELLNGYQTDRLGGMNIDAGNAEVYAQRYNGDVAEGYRDNPAMKLAFLAEKGERFTLPMKSAANLDWIENQALEYIRLNQPDLLNKLLDIRNTTTFTERREKANAIQNEVVDGINRWAKDMYDVDNLYSADDVYGSRIVDMAIALSKLDRGDKELDYYAAKDLINDKTDETAYMKWLRGLFGGVIEKKGIRNKKDLFTPSGNRRSFEQLHWEITLENIVNSMRGEETQKGQAAFTRSIIGTSPKEYRSISEVKADSGRLQIIPKEEFDALRKAFNERMFEMIDTIRTRSTFDAVADLLCEAVEKYGTNKPKISAYLKREGDGWTNNAASVTDDLVALVKDIQQMPTGYFEAKPRRAVGLDEIRNVIVPDSAPAELFDALKEKGIPYETYPAGDEEARKDALNSKEDLMFSKKVTDTDYLAAVERGDMETAQRMVDEAAKEWGAYPAEDGKPRRFYHGTNSGRFTVFDRKLIGTAREGDVGFFGRGFYFAFHQGEASMYGRNVIDAYLRMKKPFNFIKELTTYNGERTSIYGASDAVFAVNFAEKFPTLANNHFVEVAKKGSDSIEKITLAKFAKQFRDVYQHKEFSVQELDGYNGKEWDVFADKYTETFTGSDGKEHSFTDYRFQRPFYDESSAKNKLNQTYEYLSNAVYSYLQLPRTVDVIQETDFSGELQKRGYDGLVQSEQGDEAVVFNENQIKSADPVTYDDAGNVIPLSERFDEEKEDIRWSKKVTDTDYLAAVERGDMEAAQEMVDEAAKEAGYTEIWAHGSTNAVFTSFDLDRARGAKAVFLSDKGTAAEYARTTLMHVETRLLGKTITTIDDALSEIARINDSFHQPKKNGNSYKIGKKEFSEAGIIDYANDIRNRNKGGVYRLYVKRGMSLVVNANNAHWNRINSDYGSTTDEIADWARQDNYDSVEIQNVFDGGFSNEIPSDVLIVFDGRRLKTTDPVTYDDAGNVIPLSERFNEEEEDIRWSKKAFDVQRKFDEAVARDDELKKQLDATRTLLADAKNRTDAVDAAAWASWAEGGGERAAAAIGRVVAKYNDETMTGVSNDELTDRIMLSLRELLSTDYAPDALVNDIWRTMWDKATWHADHANSEQLHVIRETMTGKKYAIDDGAFNNLVEIAGSRSQLNDALHRVYGFILVPAKEAERRGVTLNFATEMAKASKRSADLFSGSTYEDAASVGDAQSMAAALYELQDALLVEGNETVFETALREAGDFAEDIIRNTPLHVAANDYVARMDELRQTYEGRLKGTKEHYIQKRHEETLKRADSASRKKALKKIEGQVRWLRDRFERGTTAQHIPARLRELLKPFIDAFLQEPTKDSGDTTLFTKDMIERLSLFYAGLEDGKNQDGSEKENADSDPLFGRTQKYITELLDELRRRLADKKLNSRNKAERLDADELDAISKVLANVIKIVREENTLFVDGKRVKYHESGHAWEQTIMDAKTNGKAANLKKAMNKLRTHNKFQMGMLKPIYFFNKVIGGEAEKYFNDIREAQNRWAFRVQEASQFFAKTTKQYNYFKWRDTMDSFLLDNGSAVVLTKDAVMQLYVTHEREKRSPTPTNHLFGGGMVLSDDLLKLQKKKNLTGDMKGKDYTFVTSLAQSLTLDDLQRMFNTLTDEQKKYAEAVVGYMSSTVAEWGNEASREMLGFDNFTEPYYFPYVVSGSYLSSKVGQQNDIRLKNIGFTHALTQGANKPIVVAGFSDIAAKHVGSMASYSTLALPLDNLQRIRNYRDKETGETVASLMKEVYGSNDAFSYISTFLEQMNGAVRTDNTVGFLEKGLGWYKRSAVALNLSVVFQQPSAIARAMAIVPRRYFVGLPHLTEYKELKQYSGVAVVKEMGGYDTDTGRATQQYILGDFTTSQKLSEKTGWLANKADEITWSQIWNAVKRETAKEMGLKYRGHGKMSKEFYQAAARRFNDVADYSQVYDSTLSRSQFMRSKNPLAKVLTAFMAEPTTTYNMLLFGNLGEEHKAAATASIVLALLGNAILNRLLKSLVQAWRDWDDDPYWERYIKDTVQGLVGKAGGSKLKWVNSIPGLSNLITSELNPLNDVVFVKDVISYLQGYEVENMYLSVIGDLINTVETAYNKIEKMGDSADWKDWVDVIGPVVTKLTALTPIPLQSIFRDTWTWSRNEEQRMRNRGLEELEDYKNLLAEAKDAGSFAKGLQVIADKFGYTGFARHMRNMLEQTFKGEWDENEQLYNAILQKDKHALEKYTRVTKEDIARYTDEANDEFLATEHAQDAKTKQYHTKIQEALRQMDDRIEEAALALLDNDLDKAQRLADAIARDGFELQDVYNAIHKTRNELKPPEPYEKKDAKDAYLATYDMLQEAYEEGDLDFAAAIRNDMIVNQGKADKDVDSKIAGYVKNEVENGEISYADARKALEDFTTLTAKDIDGKMVTYINDAFKAGEMTLAEAKNAYEDFTGYNDATVKSKLITQIGYRYANLDDMTYDEVKKMYQEIGMNEARIGSRAATLVVNDYKAGRITDKEEAVRQYIEQSGMDDEEEARRQFDYIDFTTDMPEIDLSRTDYDAWVTTVQPAGVSFDTFYSFTVDTKGMSGDTAEAKHQYFADNNSKGFGIKQAQVLPVIAKLPISNKQKDEIYKAYGWSAKKLDYTPWHNPGYWYGLLD